MTRSSFLLGRGSWPEVQRITALLRRETVGGALLVATAVVAIVWANSPLAHSYHLLRETAVGPSALGLHLTLEQWAADGLLAIFFFVAGLELKREFVAGDLRSPRQAAIPVAAAVGGMIVPAGIYLLINAGGGTALGGWAIPTATDIAFALAVLAVISTHLPARLRTFLLTLAVVDDLLAITIIAIFYTAELRPSYLLLALVPLAGFTLAVQRRVRSAWVLLPLAMLTWGLMHASGVHATVAGVLMGFAVPVIRSQARGGPEAGPGLAEHFEHRFRPLSAGVAVPIFAFFAAGVTVGGLSGLGAALSDRVAIGIVVALIVGKTVGITVATAVTARVLRAPMAKDMSWWDLIGLAILGGIGFTVSLLIGGLAFADETTRGGHVQVGVLVGSVLSALLATVVLRMRNRVYRQLAETESTDLDGDGIPEVYQQEQD